MRKDMKVIVHIPLKNEQNSNKLLFTKKELHS